jgi:osmotically-inducible protein OsmY
MTTANYSPSDLPLADRVKMAIHERHPRLVRVEADVTGAEVVHLTGRVGSFHLRQLAVTIARHVPGVRYVSDGIQVVSSSPIRRKPR